MELVDDDYETLPSGSSMSAHLIAGALAGISEHTIIYPIDFLKVSLPFAMMFIL